MRSPCTRSQAQGAPYLVTPSYARARSAQEPATLLTSDPTAWARGDGQCGQVAAPYTMRVISRGAPMGALAAAPARMAICRS